MDAVPGRRRVVLIDGCRTPFLKANSEFRNLNSYQLARAAIKSLVARNQLDTSLVGRVILGSVISNIQTSNVAREAMLGAGLSYETPAFTVTQACISANAAICNGFELIAAGQVKTVIAGGTESMSDIPIRFRKKFRQKLVESQKYRKWSDYFAMLKGLSWRDLLPEIPSITEFSTGRTMGQDCDRLAARIGVSREEQDRFALASHRAAARADREGLLAREIEPVAVPPRFAVVDRDNGIRGDSSEEKLARLRPAFVKPYGTVTAGNASFLTDGAAVVLIMEESQALSLGYRPKAYLRHYFFSAQDPREDLLLGPAFAVSRLLERTGLSMSDMDVFEFHEAFAGQLLANLKCLESKDFAQQYLKMADCPGAVPLQKLNRWGGSLSLGHPFGATGARLITTAANRLLEENGRYAMVAACAAGAMGHAMILERYPQP